MHKNYVVLELSADEFIKSLLDSINQSPVASDVKVDEKLLKEIFVKKINSGK